MDKIKTFNSYIDMYFVTEFKSFESDEQYYSYAIERLTLGLSSNNISPDKIKDEIEQILFWAFYTYGEYTFRDKEPIMDVEVEHLPINMNPFEYNQFKEAIQIVVEHYEGICKELGKLSPILMKDFETIFNRTEKFSMEIPALWLGV